MTRERLINRRQQGDLGEFSAMEWLANIGAAVLIPIGHSPDFDLVAELEGQLLRIQVKTSTVRIRTPNGHERWEVQLATNGGNQSWTGETKKLDPARLDFVFVLVGDGRRWFIPGRSLEALTAITLGGPKYSEFEIAEASPIEHLVYGKLNIAPTIDRAPGEYPSGQRTAPVKRQAYAFAGSNPASPTRSSRAMAIRIGQTRVSANHQVTVPRGPFDAAGLQTGDRMRVIPDGEGRVILERIQQPSQERLSLG